MHMYRRHIPAIPPNPLSAYILSFSLCPPSPFYPFPPTPLYPPSYPFPLFPPFPCCLLHPHFQAPCCPSSSLVLLSFFPSLRSSSLDLPSSSSSFPAWLTVLRSSCPPPVLLPCSPSPLLPRLPLPSPPPPWLPRLLLPSPPPPWLPSLCSSVFLGVACLSFLWVLHPSSSASLTSSSRLLISSFRPSRPFLPLPVPSSFLLPLPPSAFLQPFSASVPFL